MERAGPIGKRGLWRICVTGTPGTGKTEVGRRLAKEMGWRFVEVNELAKSAVVGRDPGRKSLIVDVKKLAPAVRKLRNVVLAGHFAHELPCDCIVVLRCEPAVLRKRLLARGWAERKVRENVEAELFGVIEEEARERAGRSPAPARSAPPADAGRAFDGARASAAGLPRAIVIEVDSTRTPRIADVVRRIRKAR